MHLVAKTFKMVAAYVAVAFTKATGQELTPQLREFNLRAWN